MANKQIRVSPDKEDWGRRVHKSNAERDSAHTETKAQAIQKAQEIAKNQNLETKIQNKDWQIGWGNSYGKDPCPPKDTK